MPRGLLLPLHRLFSSPSALIMMRILPSSRLMITIIIINGRSLMRWIFSPTRLPTAAIITIIKTPNWSLTSTWVLPTRSCSWLLTYLRLIFFLYLFDSQIFWIECYRLGWIFSLQIPAVIIPRSMMEFRQIWKIKKLKMR